MIRSFFRDSLVYGFATVISQGLAFFLVPLYTRVLSPGDYGALEMLMIFGNFANVSIALEVSQGMSRHYCDAPTKEEKQKYASTALWFTLGMNAVFIFACFLFAGSINTLLLGKSGLISAFRLGVVFISLNGLFILVLNQLRWELRSREYALVSILYSLTTMSAAATLTYGLGWGLNGVLLGQMLGASCGALTGLWLLRGTFKRTFASDKLKDMLRFSMPLVPSSILMSVNLYIDRLLLKHFNGLYEVGIYGVGYRLASVVMLLTIVIQSSLIPLVYTHYREPETPANIARIFHWFIALSLMICFAVGLFAKEALWVLTTSAYYEAAKIVIILAPSILLWRMSVFVPGISISKKTYWEVVISFSAAILNFTLNYTLIPLLGIVGSASAMLVSSLCYFLAYLIVGQRFYSIPYKWKPLIIGLIIASILGVSGSQINISIIADLVIKTTLLLFFLWVVITLGLIQQTEISRAYGMTKLWLVRNIKSTMKHP